MKEIEEKDNRMVPGRDEENPLLEAFPNQPMMGRPGDNSEFDIGDAMYQERISRDK